jgi:hypothetical protein
MAILNNKNGTQGIIQSIPLYEGDPNKFKNGFKKSKNTVLVQANQNRTKLIAH